MLSAQVHAVVLNLPKALCLQRARDRTGHEGNVEGAGAARVVGMMNAQFQKAGLPLPSEGLASVLVSSSARLAQLITRQRSCKIQASLRG